MCLKIGMVHHISCLRLSLDKLTSLGEANYLLCSPEQQTMVLIISRFYISSVCVYLCLCLWQTLTLLTFEVSETVKVFVMRDSLCSEECLAAIHGLHPPATSNTSSYAVVTNNCVSRYWQKSAEDKITCI